MKVWVCRTGQEGQYHDMFCEKSCLFLTREGFDFDLKSKDKDCLIERFNELLPGAAKQTISNSWSQVDIFANQMEIGDLVLIPHKKSPLIDIAKVIGKYVFDGSLPFPYSHQRKITYLCKNVDSRSLPQNVRYSLGAFRSLFQIKQVNEICLLLKKEGVMLDEV